MSWCVPSWDVMGTNSASPKIADNVSPNSKTAIRVPKLDYEGVTELTWKNGQLGMNGLASARPAAAKPPSAVAPAKYTAVWDGPHAGGTLESIVDQATKYAAATVAADAIVPSNNNASCNSNNNTNSVPYKNAESQLGTGTCGVGSCSGVRARVCKCGGASESATCGSEREFLGRASRSTSQFSPANTSSVGGACARTSLEDHDSFCQSRSQRNEADERKRKGCSGKTLSVSTKSRAAAIHNRSERKRRDKINQKMKTLQKMVPNSSKTDKASMLDEVIEYLKQLEGEVQFMRSRMSMSSSMMMSLPLAQMSMMGPPMGMGMGIMGRMMPPVMPGAAAGFLPPPVHDGMLPPDMMSAFLACHSQPMTMEAYSRLHAAMYQHLQQPPPGPGPERSCPPASAMSRTELPAGIHHGPVWRYA
ncbi:Transcription factor UNE10 [Striga hermonthica]|uniref:Transcription factor UNE10 n=1 Tax=Striga hermonthica TaxID=68872 RepID=A0A9N7MK63_STRHE|nr:Transcription factor UNE10 [Striga hermonthica]